ncbi:hypothetical protein JKP75_03645 [Blastococcus sp. TML/M2B]|uniref:hypothetical protein n=1 Tax=unclassified Blastococcus TaxID=2619396 RepID=UPI00190D5655|nr:MULTISPECIES: hypothetical protein [unclassified Blastococcus]MBN1091743.1 hypothetical protein [Blastococcus sp. TML/M2B]MBN1094698.1 hypothetical protein [Blastococcus sp. TML/C7B]
MPDSPTPGAPSVPGLRQRARMLLPVVVPLMIHLLIRIGQTSRASLVVAGVLLAALAVGSLLWVRGRAAEEPGT